MIGDRLVLKKEHTERAKEIAAIITEKHCSPWVVSIAGESGAGKSETASEICRLLNEAGISAGVLQQDDYFVFPPTTNALMRKRNIDQVGLYEVKLDFLESNLRSFKRGENPVYKPLIDFDADKILYEERDFSGLELLIVEGTYTSLLSFVDFRIFIDCNFRQTLKVRQERNREATVGFMEEILMREHEIIREHRKLADIVIASDYESISKK